MTTDTPNQASSFENADKHEIDTLILDTGPIIKNVCSPQSLLAKAGNLVTLPSVVSEIRDAATRSRFETLWAPFLKYRSPKPESIRYISQFAKKTGDYGVLGATDLQVLALTYEVECEKVGGVEEFEKRLKKKEEENSARKSGRAKKNRRRGDREKASSGDRIDNQTESETREIQGDDDEGSGWTTIPTSRKNKKPTPSVPRKKAPKSATATELQPAVVTETQPAIVTEPRPAPAEVSTTTRALEALSLESQPDPQTIEEIELEITSESEDDWITPENLAVHLISDGTVSKPAKSTSQIMTACCTTDFAMQNVLLQLHIHLFSPTTMSRITGNVYSLAKPQHGTASMKGVRENVVLSEDQREYEKALKDSKRYKERDLMDMDYLPGLLTGERLGHGGNPKIGAGKNVNASKRGGK
ncbi:Nin1 binding protein [Orbilia oligospora]|nr:Nin1 binding protein [Orbilia oligospora]